MFYEFKMILACILLAEGQKMTCWLTLWDNGSLDSHILLEFILG